MIKLWINCLTIMCSLIAVFSVEAEPDTRPNIVLIMCDDMGYSDISSHVGEIDTPNLDCLAKKGVRFRDLYDNAKCEHIRASLITGQWWYHFEASPRVEYKGKTFGARLREVGYRALISGKWHAGQTPYQRGFDRYFGLTDGCCDFWNPGAARPGEPSEHVRPLYWSYKGSALSYEEWKPVGNREKWELCNLVGDPTELNHLANKHPDRAKTMAKQWKAWWDDKGKVK